VLPFRVNPYLLEELIDWRRVPDDPIFRLTFPQREMLEPEDYARLRELLDSDASDADVEEVVGQIRAGMNPHPAGQVELNTVRHLDRPLAGVQHKYADTVLVFPAAGQTCHAYCSYCFRWPQFVGGPALRFASRDQNAVADYVRSRPDVTSVLFTGGDPLVMKTEVLARQLEPFLASDLERVSIRIGTKAPAWWPHRFLADPDADGLLRLFERIVAGGRHLTLVAHYSHPRELATGPAQAALRRILDTGAVVRCQAPVVRHVNDSGPVWAELWSRQVRLGAVPYYLFVERDTGPRRYFELPLARALEVFDDASRLVSGLARTARGPVMSATPGKVLVDGVVEAAGEPAFVLKLLRARDPSLVNHTFLARFDESAAWLDELDPLDGSWPPAQRAAQAAPNPALA
jgi:L-lysine 2,3-aminomutase